MRGSGIGASEDMPAEVADADFAAASAAALFDQAKFEEPVDRIEEFLAVRHQLELAPYLRRLVDRYGFAPGLVIEPIGVLKCPLPAEHRKRCRPMLLFAIGKMRRVCRGFAGIGSQLWRLVGFCG